MTPEELVVARRLPLPDRRAHPGRGAGDPARRASRAGPSAPRALLRDGATRPTPRRPAGSATATSKLVRLAKEAVADGFTQIKLKVGGDLDDDLRRMRSPARPSAPTSGSRSTPTSAGTSREAIDWMRALAPYDPYWIEEPTSPDDVLGHAAIRGRPQPDQGGHRRARRQPGRLQAAAAGAGRSTSSRSTPPGSPGSTRTSRSCCWPPSSACRSARTPAASGLCELVQHLSMFDYVAVSGSSDDRVIEYVDHLHEHFVDPAVIANGRYRGPAAPGFSARMLPESIADHRYPDGPVWRARAPRGGQFVTAAPHPGHRRTSTGWAPLVTGGASGIGAATATLLLARGRPGRRLDRETAGAPDGHAGAQAPTSPTTRRSGGGRRGRAPSSARLDIVVNNAGIGARARSRTTPTTSGSGCWTSTSSAWSASPGPRCRTCARSAADRPAASRSPTPARSPPRPGCPSGRSTARPRARSLAHPGDGRRPRTRRHPGQLRQPRHRGHPVGRPAARPAPTTRRPSARHWTPASRWAGWSPRTRSPARSPTWRARAASAVTGTALAVDGGMQGLRLRPAN